MNTNTNTNTNTDTDTNTNTNTHINTNINININININTNINININVHVNVNVNIYIYIYSHPPPARTTLHRSPAVQVPRCGAQQRRVGLASLEMELEAMKRRSEAGSQFGGGADFKAALEKQTEVLKEALAARALPVPSPR